MNMRSNLPHTALDNEKQRASSYKTSKINIEKDFWHVYPLNLSKICNVVLGPFS